MIPSAWGPWSSNNDNINEFLFVVVVGGGVVDVVVVVGVEVDFVCGAIVVVVNVFCSLFEDFKSLCWFTLFSSLQLKSWKKVLH